MHRSHTLIVVPPALRDGWERTLDEFKLDNYTIVNNGSLHKIKNPALYDLVIVDEAHKFRSDTASMYNELQKLCKTQCRHSDGSVHDKKVILVSATPLNNKPEDIANLVYLFKIPKTALWKKVTCNVSSGNKLTNTRNSSSRMTLQIYHSR